MEFESKVKKHFTQASQRFQLDVELPQTIYEL